MSISTKSLQKYLLAFIVLILFLVSFNGFMGEDEGRFSYFGKIWAKNVLPPYIDSIEGKTPGIFVLNVIPFELFGTKLILMRILAIASLMPSSFLIFY